MAVDARAKKILLDYFWSSKGWRDEGARSISPDDRAHAMAAGLMSAPWTVDHDGLLEALGRGTRHPQHHLRLPCPRDTSALDPSSSPIWVT